MFLLVDSHAHLDAAAFDCDRDAVVARAAGVGVQHILTVGTDLATSQRAIELARCYPGLHAAVGLHPSAAERFDQEAAALQQLLDQPEVCAVGEIGLDYHRVSTSPEIQRRVFHTQLEWAAARTLPVVVHDREAHADVLACLRSVALVGAVLHCFSGDALMAEEAVRMGLFISFAGNVTYPKATSLQEIARCVPLTALLLETDSPYLSPQPWRGRRNEPMHLTAIANKVAELRELAVDEVARATSTNAMRLFGWNEGQ
jgi:TatD DNase family protein